MNWLTGWGGWLLSVIGVATSVYYGRKSLHLEQTRKKLEWTDLQSAARDLADRVPHRADIDFIVTPGLNGATFTNLLVAEWHRALPAFVGITLPAEKAADDLQIDGYWKLGTTKWLVFLPNSVLSNPESNVLIVDDFTMSGDFLQSVKTRFVEKGFHQERLWSMTVVATSVAVHARKAPDFYWMEYADDTFYFPWGKAK